MYKIIQRFSWIKAILTCRCSDGTGKSPQRSDSFTHWSGHGSVGPVRTGTSSWLQYLKVELVINCMLTGFTFAI